MIPIRFLVHHYEHARAALLAAKRENVRAVLVCAPQTAAFAGVRVAAKMMLEAQKETQNDACALVVDCGRSVGAALAAIALKRVGVYTALTGGVYDMLSDAARKNGVRIEEVVGPTYRGYMMIVRDPAQVIVGVSHNPFSKAHAGKKVNDIIASYDAVGGINAGAFYDANGTGNGGEPLGLVYSEGKRLNRADNGAYKTVVGFDKENILRVGTYTSDDAEKIGLRDAVAFGPALIVNGKAATIKGNSSGLNPRSAIGQRSDGAVLLLAIDGRQANSFGASYADLIKVMQDYGAVNACNLDGGSSTVMYYEGEQKNDGMAISASRRLPTAWIVKRGEN